MRYLNTFILTVLIALTSCSQGGKKYKIGVSQCSEDIWRNWQNAEMRMEANFHENMTLAFATARDDSQLQSQQIDSLVASGIDLLIVAPNQLSSVSPAIDRAYDSGVLVIVFERKTDSRKYTAFVSADNYEMGRQMGEYIAMRLNGQGRLMEILGLKGSSPADERHRGFRDAIAHYPAIEVVAMLQGDWTEETAYNEVKRYAENASDLPLFCGIDGLPGKEGGICQVRDSLLTASYIYPTRGDLLLQVALDILEGRPYEKEIMLTSALVTRENANVLLLESDEVMRRAHQLEFLQEKASSYLQQLNVQHIVMLLAGIVIFLLLLAILLFYLYHRNKVNMQRERVVQNLWNLELPAKNIENTKRVESTEGDSTLGPNSTDSSDSAVEESIGPSPFITRFKEVVEKRMDDSELSVEDIAADMNLSRVQLYRKVKMLSGSSPVELLRTARLNRGYQLLLTTDKTVSEVAYAVGFSAPAYFTKCFKEVYGMLPGEVKK